MKDVGERDSSQSTVEVLDDEGVEQLQSMLGSNETTTAASGEYIQFIRHTGCHVMRTLAPLTYYVIAHKCILFSHRSEEPITERTGAVPAIKSECHTRRQ